MNTHKSSRAAVTILQRGYKQGKAVKYAYRITHFDTRSRYVYRTEEAARKAGNQRLQDYIAG